VWIPDAAPTQLIAEAIAYPSITQVSWMLDLLIDGLRGVGMPE
jgi:hypothetical protein